MKRLIIILLFLASLTAYGQKMKCGSVMPINTADRVYGHIEGMVWPYIWDISLGSLNDEFFVIKYVDVEDSTESKIPCFLIELDGERKIFLDKSAIILLWNNKHKTRFFAGNAYIEFNPDSKYCRSYSWTAPECETGDIYYSEFDFMDRISRFSLEHFSADAIIKSGRTLTPNDPWEVTYSPEGYVVDIRNTKAEITFDWDIPGKTIDYRSAINLYDGMHYDICRVCFDELDEHGRWTKETFYKYDVIDDKMVPYAEIYRTFFPVSRLKEVIPRYYYCSDFDYEIWHEYLNW